MTRIDRRRLLRLGLAGFAGLALPGGVATGVGISLTAPIRHRSPAVPRFAVPLPFPPVLRPTVGGHVYELRQMAREVEILPGLTTRIWGYGGSFPGPTIEARAGQPVQLRVCNELPVPTVTHLHGGITPPEHDGFPTDLILPTGMHHAPGQAGRHALAGPAGLAHGARTYHYPNQQRSATLWYHDHRMDFTGP